MKKKVKVDVRDKTDVLIKNVLLTEVEVKEDFLLNKSKIEYDNEEPCIIIRTCIRNDLYNEFSKYLRKAQKKGNVEFIVGELPDLFQECFDFGNNAYKLIIC